MTPKGCDIPPTHSGHPGASAVYCSAHDLMRFGMFHLKQPLSDQKAILTEQSLDEMQAPSARQSALERYGIGWRIYDGVEDHFMCGHSGGMDGVNTLLNIVPSAQIVVALLTERALARRKPLFFNPW